LGHNSSYSQTTGLANTSVGYLAGYNTTTGSGNAAFGKDALKNATTAGYNTAIGERAFGNGTLTATAAYNTALGHYAGYGLTGSAINNTFLGSSAGYLVTSGSKNTIVGRFNGNTFLDMRTLDNHVVLSDGDGLARIIHDGDDVWLDTSYEGYSGADNNLALFKRINVGNLASGGTPVDEDEINRGVAYITGEVGYDNTFRTVIDNISGNLVGFMVHGQVGVSDKTQDQFAFLCSRRGLSGGLEFMNSGGSSVVQMNWTGSVYQLQLKSSSSTYGQGFYLMVRPL
jgi:hypothetical protein